jgi:uncharacterized membrane protein YdjX (TVP38/TMEM64 family)
MKNSVRALILGGLIALLGTLVWLAPVGEWLTSGVAWIQGHGRLAWGVFIGVYIIATVAVVPGTILTLAAGLLFGLPLGVALVSAGSVLGAAAAFLVGRFLARAWIAQRVASRPSFRALDAATRHEGFLIVLLARLSPLFPFNLLNYGLGLTAVRFRDYFFASWIGMLPATIVYVYLGSLAANIAELASGEIEGGLATQALLIAGFVATVLLTVLITRKATGVLRAHLGEDESEAERGSSGRGS